MARRKRKSKIRRWFEENWGYILILFVVLILTIFVLLVVLK